MAVGVAETVSQDDVSPNEALDNAGDGAADGAVSGETPEDVEASLTGGESEGEVEEAEASGDEEDAEGEEQESAAEPEAKESGSQKRIRQLNEKSNALADELRASRAETARVIAAMQTRFEQQQAAERERYEREQYERQRAEYERSERERYEKLPLADQLKWDAARMADERAQQREQALRQEFEQRWSERDRKEQEREAQFKRRERLAALDRSASSAMQSVLLKDLDPNDVKGVQEDFMDVFLAWAGGKGEMPEVAAPKFRKVLETMALAITKSKSRASKQQVNKQKTVAGTGSASKSPAAAGTKSKKPSYDELQKMGYSDYIDYEADRLMRGQ